MMIKKESYLVEGMTCSGCERTVQKVVANVKGVVSAKADLGASTVTVEYDSNSVSVDAIRSAVNSVGYKFVGQRQASRQHEGSDEAVS